MLSRKKLSFLVVLAVFLLVFAAGCDSGSNNGNDVTAVKTEADFSDSLVALSSGETVEIGSDFGTDSSSFTLDKDDGNYNIVGVDSNNLKTIDGNLIIGNGSTIDVVLANLDLNGSLTVDIGSGDLDLNNIKLDKLNIKSAGSESVHLNQNSAVKDIEISGSGLRLVVNTENRIENLEILVGADEVVVEGNKAKISNAVVNAEQAKFKGFKPDSVKGTKIPEYLDLDDDQIDNIPTETTTFDSGYLNLSMSSEGSLNSVQILNNANKPENPGKPVTKEISEVNVVIERIEFNNRDGSGWQEWEAFSGPQQVDLLSENLMEEFQVEGEIKAGEFDSIRLYAAAEYDENLEEDSSDDSEESDQNTDDSITSEASINTDDSMTTEDPIDTEEEPEEDNDSGTSHLVYADGTKGELWVHAASKAGIKIIGDFAVEAGTEAELNISFAADQLINMRGPKVAPMLMPKAFKMQVEQTKGALQVEIENFAEVEPVGLLLKDSAGEEYLASEVEAEDKEGIFIFTKLEAGEYELSLEAEGQETVVDNLTVIAGQKLEKSYSFNETTDDTNDTEDTENTDQIEDPENSEEV